VGNIASRLKHEIAEVIPPTVFFFIAFQVIAFTRALMLEQYGIRVSTFVTASIAALVVAKVVLLADLLPFLNRFPEKPLVYNVEDGNLHDRRSIRPVCRASHSVCSPGRRSRHGQSAVAR
jgi:hypothetical protein